MVECRDYERVCHGHHVINCPRRLRTRPLVRIRRIRMPPVYLESLYLRHPYFITDQTTSRLHRHFYPDLNKLLGGRAFNQEYGTSSPARALVTAHTTDTASAATSAAASDYSTASCWALEMALWSEPDGMIHDERMTHACHERQLQPCALSYRTGRI